MYSTLRSIFPQGDDSDDEGKSNRGGASSRGYVGYATQSMPRDLVLPPVENQASGSVTPINNHHLEDRRTYGSFTLPPQGPPSFPSQGPPNFPPQCSSNMSPYAPLPLYTTQAAPMSPVVPPSWPRGDPNGSGGMWRGPNRALESQGECADFKARHLIIRPHKFVGVYVVRGVDVCLASRNIVPGYLFFNEKTISIDAEGLQIEFRMWNPFKSILAAGILGGLLSIHTYPTDKILYLGAGAGETVCHISDIVGPSGVVYAVEYSCNPAKELIEVSKIRRNIIPIIEDARHPAIYQMMVKMVNAIFVDLSQPDVTRIALENAQRYLKRDGYILITLKASVIDPTKTPSEVYANELCKLRINGFTPLEQISLIPYGKDELLVVAFNKPAHTPN